MPIDSLFAAKLKKVFVLCHGAFCNLVTSDSKARLIGRAIFGEGKADKAVLIWDQQFENVLPLLCSKSRSQRPLCFDWSSRKISFK